MIPALATLIFAYAIARLLLEVYKKDMGLDEVVLRALAVVVAIVIMSTQWWAIQRAGSRVYELSQQLPASPSVSTGEPSAGSDVNTGSGALSLEAAREKARKARDRFMEETTRRAHGENGDQSGR